MECLIPKIISSCSYNKAHLCRVVGISSRAYYDILDGASPRVDVALRICDYFSKYLYCPHKKWKVNDLWSF